MLNHYYFLRHFSVIHSTIFRQNIPVNKEALRAYCVWKVMAHSQKPDFVFRRNGRVHLNRRVHQFTRLLAAEVCASVIVKLDTPCSEVVWRVLATHSFASLPFTSPPVRHRVPSRFNWTLLVTSIWWWSKDRHKMSQEIIIKQRTLFVCCVRVDRVAND